MKKKKAIRIVVEQLQLPISSAIFPPSTEYVRTKLDRTPSDETLVLNFTSFAARRFDKEKQEVEKAALKGLAETAYKLCF